MAIYHRESGLTWKQYLQTGHIVEHLTVGVKRSGQEITAVISEKNRRLMASNEALARAFIYHLEPISGEIADLRAGFVYNMGLALEQLRIQRGTLESVIEQLDTRHQTMKRPNLTQARALSKIGMDHISKGALKQGLEALLKSVEKNSNDFIVQLQLGKLYLYGKNATEDVTDLPRAKVHLYMATCHANSETHFVPEASKLQAEAFLHAAIACYVMGNEKRLAGDTKAEQGFTQQALKFARNATKAYPKLAEGFYNHAKFAALLGDSEIAINSLKKAIQIDRNYCLKADADKDFDSVREPLYNLFETLCERAKSRAAKALNVTERMLEDNVYQNSEARDAHTKMKKLFEQAKEFNQKQTCFDYLDILPLMKDAQDIFNKIPQSFGEIASLKGHSSVRSIAFSPDGKYLASASLDKTVKVYHTDGFKEIAILTGHSDWVYSVAFSPDGRFLASGSRDKTVKVYHTDGFKEIVTLTGHSDWVHSVAFSPDGKHLASGSRKDLVKIYRVEGFREITTLTRQDGSCVSFSGNGKYLAGGSRDKTVKVYQTDTFEEIVNLTGHSDWIHSVAFSPDSKYLASGSNDNTIKVYQTDNFEEIATLTTHSNAVTSVVFSPDGKYLVSGSLDQTIKMYRVGDFEAIETLFGHSGAIHSVAFSVDSMYFASGSEGKTPKVWGKVIISKQELEQYKKRRLEVEKTIRQRREKAEELEHQRKEANQYRRQALEEEREKETQKAAQLRKEQELRKNRLKNKLCLTCGEKLGLWDRLTGAELCKKHRKS